MFVSKLDSAGNFIWARGMGGANVDTVNSIAVTGNGSVYTTGSFIGTADFDPGVGAFHLTSTGTSANAFVSKLSQVSIGDRVWNDLNHNGIQDQGEPGVAGAVVELYASVNTTIGDADDVLQGRTITDANGNYTLTGLLPGVNHYLIYRAPVGYTAFTTKDVGTDDTKDSDADSTGTTSTFTVSGSQSDAGRDAGLRGAAPGFGFALAGGTVGAESVRAVATDTADNVYVTGTFENGSIDFDPGPGFCTLYAGSPGDLFFAMYSSTGALVWARCVGGAVTEVSRGVDVTEDGVFITGEFNGTVDFDPGPGIYQLSSASSAVYSDIFVLKLDLAGNFVWARRMGGAGADGGDGIAVGADGSVYTTGFFSGTADFDPGTNSSTLASAGNYDVFVSKLDSAGNFVWAKRMGGTGNDSSSAIAVAADGSVSTTGYFIGSVDFDPSTATVFLTSAGAEDVFISKLDSAGNYVWARQIGGTSSDIANGIAVDRAGSVFVTGSFSATADFDPGTGVSNLTSAGSTDAFVLMLDTFGNLSWADRIGGAAADSGSAITMASDGTIYASGSFSGTVDFNPGANTFNLTTTGNPGVFVEELDYGGGFLSARSVGGYGLAYGNAIAVSAMGDVFLGGSFAPAADLDPTAGTFNLTSVGSSDFYLARFNDDTIRLTVTVDRSTLGEAGIRVAYVTVSRNLVSANPLVVYLASSDTSEATVPASVTIRPNEASFTFAVVAVDDPFADGTQQVTITASTTPFGRLVLDPTFSGDGRTTQDGAVQVIKRQSDGKIVALSRYYTGVSPNYYDFRITRYLTDGTLDPTFGSGGVVATGVAVAPDHPFALAIQQDGKILIGGHNSLQGGVLLRCNPDGTLDASLGTGGIMVGAFDISDMAVQPDGKILMAGDWSGGRGVIRMNPDGSWDQTFGTVYSNYAYRIALQTDGKIVLADRGFGLSRYTSTGALDTGFGNWGTVTNDWAGFYVSANDLAIQPDGKIVVVGTVRPTTASSIAYDFALARYNSNGTLDTTFGSGGTVISDFGGFDAAFGVAIHPNGTIVVVGTGTDTGYAGFACYRADGTLDTSSFGASLGVDANDVLIQPDGHVVIGGCYDRYGFIARYDFDPATSVVLNVTDNDVAGIVVTPTSGLVTTEAGGTANFTVVLTSEPTANVSITLSSNDTGEGTVSPAYLTFTPSNWNTARTVTITGLDDGIVDGDVLYKIVTSAATSTDSYYSGINPSDVSVTNVDNGVHSPTDMAISNNTVYENRAAGTAVGTFSTTDPDSGETFTYSLVSGDGSDDNGSFTIDSSGQLLTAAMFDYEARSSYSIRVRSTDADGAWYEKAFTIAVANRTEQVAWRRVFYNNSKFDAHEGYTSGDPAANSWDDNAIATDKTALLPSQTASLANYTSYSRGINGIMVDMGGLGDRTLTVADFEFRFGNTANPLTWSVVAMPATVTKRTDYASTADVGRVEITWPDGTLKNGWLQITVKATANTGLTIPDVFYFGNAVGETGNQSTSATVTVADVARIRQQANTSNLPVTNLFDINRDQKVTVADVALAQQSANTKLYWLVAPAPLLAAAGEIRRRTSDPGLSMSQLQGIVDAAIAQWTAAGLSGAALERMKSVEFVIADLPGAQLGMALPNQIFIDKNAAGRGWFVDATPRANEEFGKNSRAGMQAVRSDAINRIDLLSVVSHELGHVAGLTDLASARAGLMSAKLATGRRVTPTASEVDAVLKAALSWTADDDV